MDTMFFQLEEEFDLIYAANNATNMGANNDTDMLLSFDNTFGPTTFNGFDQQKHLHHQQSAEITPADSAPFEPFLEEPSFSQEPYNLETEAPLEDMALDWWTTNVAALTGPSTGAPFLGTGAGILPRTTMRDAGSLLLTGTAPLVDVRSTDSSASGPAGHEVEPQNGVAPFVDAHSTDSLGSGPAGLEIEPPNGLAAAGHSEHASVSQITRYQRLGTKYFCLYPGCTRPLFTRVSDLDRHYNAVHLQAASFWCSDANCDRGFPHGRPFPRKDKRDEHQRKIHRSS